MQMMTLVLLLTSIRIQRSLPQTVSSNFQISVWHILAYLTVFNNVSCTHTHRTYADDYMILSTACMYMPIAEFMESLFDRMKGIIIPFIVLVPLVILVLLPGAVYGYIKVGRLIG